jgi:hypothetical protein
MEPAMDPLLLECVSWGAAVNWIAFRSFVSPEEESTTPKPASQFRKGQTDEEFWERHNKNNGQRNLASRFLWERIKEGKIRVLGFHQKILKQNDDVLSEISFYPVLIPEGFFKRPFRGFAEVYYFEEEDNRFADCFMNERDIFHEPIVVVDDLLREFLGPLTELGESNVDLREDKLAMEPRKARGRPPEYDWSSFHVELTRRLLEGNLPRRASDCAGEMLFWCSVHWSREPAASVVRKWVGTFYKAFMAGDTTDRGE